MSSASLHSDLINFHILMVNIVASIRSFAPDGSTLRTNEGYAISEHPTVLPQTCSQTCAEPQATLSEDRD